MDFLQVADNFPAWDVVDSSGANIGVATNFLGEGFVVTIEADFTGKAPRTLKEPRIATLEDFIPVVALFVINLKDEWALTGAGA